MATTVTSKRFALNLADIGKGFIISVLAGGLAQLYQVLSTGTMPTIAQVKSAGVVALTSGIAYLLKNFLTPAKTVIDGDVNDPKPNN